MTIDAAPDAISLPQDEEIAMGVFMMMAGPWFPSIAFRTPPKRRIVTIVTMGMHAEPLRLQLVWLFPLPTKEAI